MEKELSPQPSEKKVVLHPLWMTRKWKFYCCHKVCGMDWFVFLWRTQNNHSLHSCSLWPSPHPRPRSKNASRPRLASQNQPLTTHSISVFLSFTKNYFPRSVPKLIRVTIKLLGSLIIIFIAYINYSIRCLIESRIIDSAAYCNQILLVPLYLNSTQHA